MNGLNVYPLFPIQLIVKNRLVQIPRKWSEDKWDINITDIMNHKKSAISTDFCKNVTNINAFIANIRQHRLDLLHENVINPSISNELLIPDGKVVNMIRKMAANLENFDYDCRHDNNMVIAMHTPPPKVKFVRRMNSGRLMEEKIFIEMMKKIPKSEDTSSNIYPKGVAGSNEWKLELDKIKRDKAFEVQYNPLDLEAVNWVLMRKSTNSWTRLEQMKKVIKNVSFDDMEGQFKSEIAKEENTILDSITIALDRLQKLQKEKDCLANNKIHPDLINANCFPEIAKIIQKHNQTMDIAELSEDSSSSLSSWSDSWSSD